MPPALRPRPPVFFNYFWPQFWSYFFRTMPMCFVIKCLRESTNKQKMFCLDSQSERFQSMVTWACCPTHNTSEGHGVEEALFTTRMIKRTGHKYPCQGRALSYSVPPTKVNPPKVSLPSSSTVGSYQAFNTWPGGDIRNSKYSTTWLRTSSQACNLRVPGASALKSTNLPLSSCCCPCAFVAPPICGHGCSDLVAMLHWVVCGGATLQPIDQVWPLIQATYS